MIAFFKNRGRALVVLFFALLSFGIFLLSTTVACRLFGEWYGIIAGCLLMALALLLHHFGDRLSFCYVIGFLLNTVGMGCFASAYYNISGVSGALAELAPAIVLPFGLVLAVCVILTAFPQIKHTLMAVMVLLIIGLTVASIAFWVGRGGEFYAFSLFSLLVAGLHLCVGMVTVDEPSRRLLRDISFGSFGMFAAVGAAALIAIACVTGDGCDCDCCDCSGCDCSGSDKKGKAKK